MTENLTNLLLVDDDKEFLENLSALLRDRYNIFTSNSYEHAQRRLKEDPIDLVLTDIKMDPNDGIRLTKYIKLHHFRIPVIVMTAYSSKEFPIQALRAGATDFLEKPFTLEDLDSSIQRVADIVYLENEILNQQIARLNASKLVDLELMAGGIAHEINNPIAIIRGYANKIIRKIRRADEYDKNTILAFLEVILKTTKRVDKIIKGIRSFTSDSIREKFEIISLQKLIEDTLFLCETKLKYKSIDLRIEPPPNIKLECRPTQLTQVLFNLINNSVDAIDNSKEKWIHINFSQSDDILEIQISDSGKGIDEKLINRLFEPFFTTKDPNKGTGLGLSICKSIVEAHQGLIEYSSSHKNTTFNIYIPTKQNTDS